MNPNDQAPPACKTCNGTGRGVYQKINTFGAIVGLPETWFIETPADCPDCGGASRTQAIERLEAAKAVQ